MKTTSEAIGTPCHRCQQPLENPLGIIGERLTGRFFHLECFKCPHDSGKMLVGEGSVGDITYTEECLLCAMLKMFTK